LGVVAKVLFVKFAPVVVESELRDEVFDIEAEFVLNERSWVAPSVTLLGSEFQLTKSLKPQSDVLSNWVSAPHDDLVTAPIWAGAQSGYLQQRQKRHAPKWLESFRHGSLTRSCSPLHARKL
jgi:hypothetical protein